MMRTGIRIIVLRRRMLFLYLPWMIILANKKTLVLSDLQYRIDDYTHFDRNRGTSSRFLTHNNFLLIVRTEQIFTLASTVRYTEFPAYSRIFYNYNDPVYSYGRHSPGLIQSTQHFEFEVLNLNKKNSIV